MKKITLLLMFFMGVSFAHASLGDNLKKDAIELKDSGISAAKQAVQLGKDAANTVDTSRLSKQIYGDVKQALIGLASALKVGVEHVYVVLVRQQIVKAITILLVSLLLILLPLIWLKKLANAWIGEKEEGAFFLGILFCVVNLLPMIGGFIFLITNFMTVTTGFVNPEYGAMTDIMEFVKAIKH